MSKGMSSCCCCCHVVVRLPSPGSSFSSAVVVSVVVAFSFCCNVGCLFLSFSSCCRFCSNHFLLFYLSIFFAAMVVPGVLWLHVRRGEDRKVRVVSFLVVPSSLLVVLSSFLGCGGTKVLVPETSPSPITWVTMTSHRARPSSSCKKPPSKWMSRRNRKTRKGITIPA